MSEAELDSFLATARTCRLATIGSGGPHVTPLWFVWVDEALWIYSVVKSQRWTDLERDPRAAAVVDDGSAYEELHGVELRGEVANVGGAPRDPGDFDAELAPVEAAYARKYNGGEDLAYDGVHAWLRLTPAKIVSWDFRKLDDASA